MIDWQQISLISLILNAALLVVVFFKSALNDILKEWWLSRRKSREIEAQRLIRFKTQFNIQHNHSLLIMVMLAQKQANLIMGSEVPQFVDENYKESLNSTSEAKNVILEVIDYLPTHLREKYRNFEDYSSSVITSIIDNHVAKEDVLWYSHKMTALVKEITDIANEKLREKID